MKPTWFKVVDDFDDIPVNWPLVLAIAIFIILIT